MLNLLKFTSNKKILSEFVTKVFPNFFQFICNKILRVHLAPCFKNKNWCLDSKRQLQPVWLCMFLTFVILKRTISKQNYFQRI